MRSFDVGYSFESYVGNRFSHEKILFSSNINIKTPRSRKPSQIDFLVYGSMCIYCIECKYYSGKLIGNCNDDMWSVNNSRRFVKVYSPFRQNLKHCRLIQNICRNSGINVPVVSVIIVSEDCSVVSDIDKDFFTLDEFFYIYRKIEKNGKLNIDKYKSKLEGLLYE